MAEYFSGHSTLAEAGNRPVPRPRKHRTPLSTAGSHPHQPQASGSLGVRLGNHSDDELDDRQLYGEPAISSAPTSGIQMHSRYEGPESSSKLKTAPQPVYSPPAVPAQHGSLYGNVSLSSSPYGTLPLATEASLPSGGYPSQREADLTREQLIESKMKLVEEVGQLRTQRQVLTQEIAKMEGERRGFHEEMEAELSRLRAEEHTLKVRIAQMQQNVGIMEQISKQGRRTSTQTGEQERELRAREERLKEFEFTLKEKETRIEKRKLELQSEADLLFQRKKELDIREYDFENMTSELPNRAQQQQEQELEIFRQKDQELQQRETALTSKELELKKKEMELRKWEDNLKMEDKRAQENTQRARKMWSESMCLKKEVEGMMAAQELQAKESLPSSGSAPSIVSPTSPSPHLAPVTENPAIVRPFDASQPPIKSPAASIEPQQFPGGGAHSAFAAGGTPRSPTVPRVPSVRPVVQMDTSEDEMLARSLAMESSREWFDRDHEMALEIARELEGNAPAASTEDNDLYEHFLLQQQLQDLGISDFSNGSSSDTSTLRRKVTETLEKKRKEVDEQLKRDQELARKMQEELNLANNPTSS